MSRAVLFAALLSNPALAIEFSSACDASLTAADRAAFEHAADWLGAHAADVRTHVVRVRADGNPYDYGAYDSGAYDRWEDEVDEWLDDKVKIRCAYTGDLDACDDAPGLMGRTYAWPLFEFAFDGVTICVDNIRAWADGDAGFQALLTATIAHELMHHADGFEGHGPGGTTDPEHPDTEAEVIGVAVEHLMLGQEHDPSMSVTAVRRAGDRHLLDLDLSVRNDNADAVADTEPSSGYDIDPRAAVCLQVDGATVHRFDVDALDGGDAHAWSTSMTVAAYTPGAPVREITAFADCDRELYEIEEGDNTSTSWHSTWVDLDVDVTLAAAPVKHTTFVGFTAVTTYTLTFRATVTNLDTDTPSPSVDLTVTQDDAFGPGTTSTSLTVPALGAGAATQLTFAVEVPATVMGAGPLGTTHVEATVDDGAEQVHDRDRGNNTWSLEVDAAWWKPDLQLVALQPTDDTTAPPAGVYEPGSRPQGLTFRVRNGGPVAADPSTLEVTSAGATLGTYTIPSLAPGAVSSPRRAVLQAPLCYVRSVTFTADGPDDVDESEESNNEGLVSLGTTCDFALAPDWRDDLGDLPIDGLVFEEIPWALEEAELLVDRIDDMITELFDLAVVGPFLPGPETYTLIVDGDSWIGLSTHDAPVVLDAEALVLHVSAPAWRATPRVALRGW